MASMDSKEPMTYAMSLCGNGSASQDIDPGSSLAESSLAGSSSGNSSRKKKIKEKKDQQDFKNEEQEEESMQLEGRGEGRGKRSRQKMSEILMLANAEFEEAEAEIKRLRRLVGQQDMKIESIKATTQNWIEVNDKLYNDLRDVQENNQEMRDKMNVEFNAKIAAQAEEIQDLNETLEMAQEEVQSLTTKVAELRVSNTELRNEVEAYKPEGNDCIACMEKDRDTVMTQCGHFVLCFGCAEALPRNYFGKVKCPLCRQEKVATRADNPAYVKIIR